MLRRTLLATAALGLGLMTTGGALAAGMDKVKACFVYVGPIGDGGWTYQHHQGALAVQEAYGDKVELQWQESVPEGADAERVLTQMALGGCNIIFTTSFGYMDQTNAVAAKFPDVKFEHATPSRPPRGSAAGRGSFGWTTSLGISSTHGARRGRPRRERPFARVARGQGTGHPLARAPTWRATSAQALNLGR